MPSTLERIGKYLVYAALSALVVGVGYFGRDFVKLKFGPLFILELIFAVVLPVALWSERRTRARDLLAIAFPVPPFLFFFILGCTHLALDIGLRWAPGTSPMRVVQHALLFVYPLLWTFLGAWLFARERRFSEILLYALVPISAVSFLLRTEFYDPVLHFYVVKSNLSVGPLVAVALLFFLGQMFESNGRERAAYALLAFLSAVLSFVPFWQMWTSSMQRTSLFLLLLALVLTPFIHQPRRPGRGALLALLTLFIFAAGSLVAMRAKRDMQAEAERMAHIAAGGDGNTAVLAKGESGAATNFAYAFNHNDDMPEGGGESGEAKVFQARFRRFMWKQSIEDWRPSPVFGIGFIPEVPSYHAPKFRNDGSHFGPDGRMGAPIAGPHNSYLSVLVRTGIVGLALVLAAFGYWALRMGQAWRHTWQRGNSFDLIGLLLFFIPLMGALFAFLHVGFESPHNSVLLWIAMGMGVSYARSLRPLS